MSAKDFSQWLQFLASSIVTLALSLGCMTPPVVHSGSSATLAADAPALEPIKELNAWSASSLMAPGINIGNTFDNTTEWEVGWGQPRVTKDYVEKLARLGFKTVRLPVAWDTYAVKGRIQPDKFRRVAEVVNWITQAGMFCVLNIHWDGGWIDSSRKDHFPKTFATFSAQAEKKYRSYWQQISSYFAGKNEKLIFEALNEETNFSNEGSTEKSYATLKRVNQLFIDTVRHTGGNNAKRLLIVTGYNTDITKTCAKEYELPTDAPPGHLFISVHYYTPWQFCGMTEDADWGKMALTWGSESDVAELNRLFDAMGGFCSRNDIPAFIGEYGVVAQKDPASRTRWMAALNRAAISRKMVPVLWETGNDISRREPFAATPEVLEMLELLRRTAGANN